MRHTEDCILHAGWRFPPQYAALRFPMHGSAVQNARAALIAWAAALRALPRRIALGVIESATLSQTADEQTRARHAMLSITPRTLMLMALGVTLYGLVSWVTNIFPIATGTGV